jgi:flagellar protein FliL
MAEPEKKPEAKPAEAKPAEKKPEEAKKPDAAKGEAAPPAEGAEGAKPEAAAPAAKGGSSKLTMIIMLGSLVALPITGFAVAYFALAPKIKAEKQIAEGGEHGKDPHAKDAKAGKDKKDAHGKDAKKDDHAKKDDGHGGGHGEAGGPPPAKFALTEQIVNVAGTRGTRFLRAGMEFEAPAEVLDEMTQRKAQMMDIVSNTLAQKRLDELEAPDIRQKLRAEIITLVNHVLKDGEVTNLYFTELVIQ